MIKNVQEPVITTASIEVNVIKIGKKQMTIAVFKQLVECDETDNSEIWGVVRYKVNDCDQWLLFVEKEELCKRQLYQDRIQGIYTLNNNAKEFLENYQKKKEEYENKIKEIESSSICTKDFFIKEERNRLDQLDQELLRANDNIELYKAQRIYFKQELDYINNYPHLFIAV